MSAGAAIAIVLGGLALSAGLITPGDEPTARIAVTRGADSYQASAVVEGAVGTSGTYTLLVTREGQSGRSRSQQGGAFALTSPTDTLSTAHVNVSPGDTIEMALTVEWADGTIATDAFAETIE